MSFFLTNINLDEKLKNEPNAVNILNDLPCITEEEKEDVHRLLMTVHEDGEELSTIPSCVCGHLSDGTLLHKVCHKCGTVVTLPIEHEAVNSVWIRAPSEHTGFVNIMAWIRLNGLFGKKTFTAKAYSILDWTMVSGGPINDGCTKKCSKQIDYMVSNGWRRGLAYMRENYDEFIRLCSAMPETPAKKRIEICTYLEELKDTLFCKHLPFPSKRLLVLEKTSVRDFTDLTITGAIDAARTVMGITKTSVNTPSRINERFLERKTVSIIKSLCKFYHETMKKSFNGKKGVWRGNILSQSAHWTGRAVATSIVGPHHYEDLHITWSQGLELFKIHIVNIMMKSGVPERDCIEFIERNVNKVVYDRERKMLHRIMMWLIKNCDNGEDKPGIPALLGRNPTLERNSAIYVLITKIKIDVESKSISVPFLILKGLNMDFDGDEGNLIISLARDMTEAFKAHKVWKGIHSFSEFETFNSNIDLPDATLATMANYINNWGV